MHRTTATFLCLAIAWIPWTVSVAGAAEISFQTSGAYRIRTAPGFDNTRSDQDEDLELWARANAAALWGGRLDGRLALRAFKDIDEARAGDKLQSIGDTYSHRGDVQLYEGYLTLRLLDRHRAALSAGRQYVPVGQGFAHSYDGVSLRAKSLGEAWRLVLFGGARVSHYLEPDRKAIFGGRVQAVPWSGGLVELSEIKYTRHAWEIGAEQHFLGEQSATARAAFVDRDPESIRLAGQFYLPARFEVEADYLRKLSKGMNRKDFPFDFTSLDDGGIDWLLLGLPAPYARYHINVRKRLGQHLVLGAGGARRKLVHDLDEDEFNKSDWEAEASGGLRDFPLRGFTAFARYRHLWEDRKKSDDGSSSVYDAGVSFAITRAVSVGIDVFGNRESRTVAEPILPEGFASIDRKERGRAVWGLWKGDRLTGAVRYERSKDDLYRFYGAKEVDAATLTLTAGL